jgi:hypothetical protein
VADLDQPQNEIKKTDQLQHQEPDAFIYHRLTGVYSHALVGKFPAQSNGAAVEDGFVLPQKYCRS